MKIILVILAVITLVLSCFILWIDKIGHEKRFCHFCEELFLEKKHKNKNCPFCGKPLTTYYERETQEENENPFTDFNDKENKTYDNTQRK